VILVAGTDWLLIRSTALLTGGFMLRSTAGLDYDWRCEAKQKQVFPACFSLISGALNHAGDQSIPRRSTGGCHDRHVTQDLEKLARRR
jgi:hypothetical protein